LSSGIAAAFTIVPSIVAVATATLLVDLIYPLLDPRIRQR